MLIDLSIIALCILLSAFFSSSETAFVLVNKLKVEIKAKRRNRSARTAHYFSSHTDKFFATILIGNTIVGITFASVSALLLTKAGFSDAVILVLSTTVLLIFGELIPKFIAREAPDQFTHLTIIPVKWMSVILSPFIKFTTVIARFLTRQEKLGEEAYSNFFDREDLQNLVSESEKAGTVGKNESQIINKVLMLKHQKVSGAMRPRTEVVGVETGSSIGEVMTLFIESGFSKLPVYEDNLDNIKGVVLAYDLFNNPSTLEAITRDVMFVPEVRKSIDVLNDFLQKRQSFAIVVDEFGGTAGIVTREDIMEEMFGEIKDEYDIEEDICRKVDENTFIISGKIEVDYVNEHFNLHLPKGDYETVGGLITARAGKIPSAKDDVVIEHFSFHIIRATNVRIEMVKLSIIQSP